MRYAMVVLCLCLLPQWAMAESATASLDRSITSWGESVLLQIRVDGSADKDPDLSVLKNDFDILNQSQSSNYSLINGHMSRSKSWTINLMPKRKGNLVIPAISLGNVSTQPLHLQVLAEQSSQSGLAEPKDIYLEVSANSQDVYVQAEVLLTVKLFRAVNLVQAQLTEVDVPHAIIKKMGDDKNYETVRDQRRFIVTERRYAVFPEQSGVLHVPALQFTGQVVSQRSMFNQAGRTLRITSKPLDIMVEPTPKIWSQGQPWLPAKSVTIREIPTDAEAHLKVGEPFTRTIEIRAEGLTAEQLPPIFTHSSLAGFKLYPDKPELSTELGEHGLVGIRREKVAMIPTQAGDVSLPAIAIVWWNTATQTVHKSEVLQRMITVLPADNQPVATPSAVVPSLSQSTAKPAQSMPPIAAEQHDDGQVNLVLWQALTAFFVIAWIMTLLLWWKSTAKSKQIVFDDEQVESTVSLKVLRKQLELACKQNQAKQVEQLLPQWARVFFDDASIIYLGQLKGYTEDLDQALLDLEAFLYDPENTDAWHGDVMLRAISQLREPDKVSQQLGLKSLAE